jgi:MFS family permease
MSSSPHALTLLREKPFFLLLVGRVLSSVAYQIGAVCIGWQIYALTHSAYALGLAGLTQFIPMAVLTFAAGHAADRYPRQRVLQMCQVAEAAAAFFMAVFTFCHWLTVPEIFGAIVILSGARAFGTPASAAMLPGTVPEAYLSRATALSSGTFQAATIVGPALGGFAYAALPALPYAMMTALWLAATAPMAPSCSPARSRPGRRRTGPPCSPAPASSGATRRFWARCRWICLRCCWAAPPGCFPSMRAIFCIPARGAWGCCAAPSRPGR